jgi:hypothetical protein
MALSVFLFWVDSSTSGSRFHASASPSLAHFVRDTAEEIAHPSKEGRTLWDARFDTGTLFGGHIDKEVLAMHEEFKTDGSLGVGALGSGSDYTVFLQHIGVGIPLYFQQAKDLTLCTGCKLPSCIPVDAARSGVSLSFYF